MRPKTLFKISLEASTTIDARAYQHLPPPIKDVLLSQLTKYAFCGGDVLQYLVHPLVYELDLRNCCMSEQDLSSLFDLKELKYLCLPLPPATAHYTFSESALSRLVENKCNIRVLRLSGHVGVTDKVVRLIGDTLLQLEILHLEGTAISDNSLFYLRNLQNLTDLNISRTRVTDAGIEELASGDVLRSLNFICVSGCNYLTDLSLVYLLIPKSNLCIFPEDLGPNMTVAELDKLTRRF